MVEELNQSDGREERLAREIADRLGDPEGVRRYVKVAKRFPEEHIQSVLEEVLAIPAERIRKNRAALFNWLVEHDGERPRKKETPADAGN